MTLGRTSLFQVMRLHTPSEKCYCKHFVKERYLKVTYASAALTDTEVRYAQIGNKTHAIPWYLTSYVAYRTEISGRNGLQSAGTIDVNSKAPRTNTTT